MRWGPRLDEVSWKWWNLALVRINIESTRICRRSRTRTQCIGHSLIRVSIGKLRLYIPGAGFTVSISTVSFIIAMKLYVSFIINLKIYSHSIRSLKISLRTWAGAVQSHLVWMEWQLVTTISWKSWGRHSSMVSTVSHLRSLVHFWRVTTSSLLNICFFRQYLIFEFIPDLYLTSWRHPRS